jgi:nucleotide-binding universal stress UspA family protein
MGQGIRPLARRRPEARPLRPVDLAKAVDAIDSGSEDDIRAAAIKDQNPEGLRPSIETSLHALLPHRFVIHTHSVRTIALAIRADAEERLAERLDGLAWAWVPYVFPGLPLTRAIRDTIDSRPIDIIVMGNHGLVVAGDDLEATASLLLEVERRLDAPAREAAPASPPPRQGLRRSATRPPTRSPPTPACWRKPRPAPTTPTSHLPRPGAATPESRRTGQNLVLVRTKAPTSPRTPTPPPTSSPSASPWSSPASPRKPISSASRQPRKQPSSAGTPNSTASP